MILVIEPGALEVKVWAFGKKEKDSCRVLGAETERLLDAKSVRELLRKASGGAGLEALAFRLPFGRDLFGTRERIDGKFLLSFGKLAERYPFYVPATARLIGLVTGSVPGVPAYAFFETGLFTRLPDARRSYALPSEYAKKIGGRKWGFHGILHEAAGRIAGKGARVLSVVFDRQTTVAALNDGKPCMVSLGQTPLEGVMGRTVSGDLDPGIIFYLMKHAGFSLYAVDRMLKEESGFRGMTGYDLTMQEFVRLYGRDDKVDLAFAVYLNQVLKYFGEGITAMGGVDALVFSGPYLDAFSRIAYSLIKRISFLGISLDCLPSEKDKVLFRITSDDSPVAVYLNGKPAAWFIHDTLRSLTGPEATAVK